MTTNETSQSQAVPQETSNSSAERWTLIFILLMLVFVLGAIVLQVHSAQVVGSSKIEQLDNSCVIASVKKELSGSHYSFLTNGQLAQLASNCEKKQKGDLQNAQFFRNHAIQSKALEKTLK